MKIVKVTKDKDNLLGQIAKVLKVNTNAKMLKVELLTGPKATNKFERSFDCFEPLVVQKPDAAPNAGQAAKPANLNSCGFSCKII